MEHEILMDGHDPLLAVGDAIFVLGIFEYMSSYLDYRVKISSEQVPGVQRSCQEQGAAADVSVDIRLHDYAAEVDASPLELDRDGLLRGLFRPTRVVCYEVPCEDG